MKTILIIILVFFSITIFSQGLGEKDLKMEKYVKKYCAPWYDEFIAKRTYYLNKGKRNPSKKAWEDIYYGSEHYVMLKHKDSVLTSICVRSIKLNNYYTGSTRLGSITIPAPMSEEYVIRSAFVGDGWGSQYVVKKK